MLPGQSLLRQDMALEESRGLVTSSQTTPNFPGSDPRRGFLRPTGSRGTELTRRRGPDPGHPVSMARDDL